VVSKAEGKGAFVVQRREDNDATDLKKTVNIDILSPARSGRMFTCYLLLGFFKRYQIFLTSQQPLASQRLFSIGYMN
jgi:hypothetical protein